MPYIQVYENIMVQPSELIDSVVNLLDHFKSCPHCDYQVLSGILDPCLLERINSLRQNDLKKEEAVCNGTNLAKHITDSLVSTVSSRQTCNLAKGFNCVPESFDDKLYCESDGTVSKAEYKEKDDEMASVISVSTTSDVGDYASSGVSSDPFSLPNIVSSVTNDTDANDETNNDSTDYATETLSIKETSSDLDTSFVSDSVSLMSDREETCISLHGDISSLDQQNSISNDGNSFKSSQPPSTSQPPLLIGRSALRNAFLQNNHVKSKTHTTSPEPGTGAKEHVLYYRYEPARGSSSSNTDTGQEVRHNQFEFRYCPLVLRWSPMLLTG